MRFGQSIFNLLMHVFTVTLALLNFCGAVKFPNDVSGTPEITCSQDKVSIGVITTNGPPSHVFAKGHTGSPGCSFDRVNNASFSLSQCGMQKQRQLEPKGLMFTIVVVVQMHPNFITKVDRAYNLRCFYMEVEKTVTSNFEVSMLTTGLITGGAPMPQCEYTLHNGGPTGSSIKYAKVGEPVFHVWSCPSVHSCSVDDGQGQKINILDANGCGVDQYVLRTPDYTPDLTQASQETHVFKFADQVSVFFNCQIKLCMKAQDGCVGITPPRCPSVPDGQISGQPPAGYSTAPGLASSGPPSLSTRTFAPTGRQTVPQGPYRSSTLTSQSRFSSAQPHQTGPNATRVPPIVGPAGPNATGSGSNVPGPASTLVPISSPRSNVSSSGASNSQIGRLQTLGRLSNASATTVPTAIYRTRAGEGLGNFSTTGAAGAPGGIGGVPSTSKVVIGNITDTHASVHTSIGQHEERVSMEPSHGSAPIISTLPTNTVSITLSPISNAHNNPDSNPNQPPPQQVSPPPLPHEKTDTDIQPPTATPNKAISSSSYAVPQLTGLSLPVGYGGLSPPTQPLAPVNEAGLFASEIASNRSPPGPPVSLEHGKPPSSFAVAVSDDSAEPEDETEDDEEEVAAAAAAEAGENAAVLFSTNSETRTLSSQEFAGIVPGLFPTQQQLISDNNADQLENGGAQVNVSNASAFETRKVYTVIDPQNSSLSSTVPEVGGDAASIEAIESPHAEALIMQPRLASDNSGNINNFEMDVTQEMLVLEADSAEVGDWWGLFRQTSILKCFVIILAIFCLFLNKAVRELNSGRVVDSSGSTVHETIEGVVGEQVCMAPVTFSFLIFSFGALLVACCTILCCVLWKSGGLRGLPVVASRNSGQKLRPALTNSNGRGNANSSELCSSEMEPQQGKHHHYHNNHHGIKEYHYNEN